MSTEIAQGQPKSRRLFNFLVVLFILSVGIGIGTVISYRVGATGPNDSQLKIATDGKPIVGGAALALSQAFEAVAKRVEPAVVNVNTEEVVKVSRRRGAPQGEDEEGMPADPLHRFFQQAPNMPEQYRRQSLGSGVIVDPKGYIITNNHVVSGATKIKVKLDNGEEYIAKVIGTDELSDLAVIKIEAAKEFPYVRLGDSKGMKVGDWVLAVGSPFGLEQTVTAGIISATGRTFDISDTGRSEMLFNDYLQTDAAINRGNSGGPLVNMNAEVVGLNTFIQSPSGSSAGVGFAVPAHIIVGVYNQILEKGKMTRGWLGVSMNTLPFTPAMSKFFGVKQGGGVIVTALSDENGDPGETGPAAKAGIKAEDVIIDFNGKKVMTVPDLRMAVANTPPGQKVKVKVVRRGVEKEFEVAVAERKIENRQEERGTFSFEEQQEPEVKPEIGLSFDNVPKRLMEELDVTGGAVVLSVKPASLADDAGLAGQESGVSDIIIEANGQKIGAAQDLLNIVKGLKTGESVVLKFVRAQRGPNNRLVTSTFYTSITKP